MAAQSLNCPNCGAAASSEATRCEHCNSRLATVACPECFGMMFRGAKFCSHCGARADRQEMATTTVCACPRCRVNMKAVVIGKTDLRECPKCEGLWAGAECFQRICTDREQQSAVLGAAMTILPPNTNAPWEQIRYVPCPVCRQLMNRVNFAKCSTVVVDVCRKHGTWLDKDELRRIVEFIQAGGFERARSQEMDDLERQRRRLALERMNPNVGSTSSYGSSPYDHRETAVGGVAAALLGFLFDV